MAAAIVTFEHYYKNNRHLPVILSKTQQGKFRNIRDIGKGYFFTWKKNKNYIIKLLIKNFIK